MAEDAGARAHEWDFFLAHASDDKGFAREMYERLTPHARVFLDEYSIPKGADWDAELAKAQRASRVTVALISSHFERAYYLREEIATGIALSRYDASEHAIMPVYLDDAARPYGLTLKQGISVREEGGVVGACRTLLDTLRTLRERPAHAEPPAELRPEHFLQAYPCGPMVPTHFVKRSIVEAYASTIPASQASSVLDDAIALRLEADPHDPEVTYVKHAHVVPPETSAPVTYWRAVFTEACLHGPRMLAALLSVVSDSRFPADAKESRQQLLELLRAIR